MILAKNQSSLNLVNQLLMWPELMRPNGISFLGSATGSPSAGTQQSCEILPSGMNLKLFYYLIATMNQVFPDYDFSDLKPDVFQSQPQLAQVINHINTTLFNTGVNRNLASFGEFSGKMWDCIDGCISLSDCETYSFVLDEFDGDMDDPFWERGCM